MNNRLMADGILGAWKSLGVRIVKWSDDAMYIEVPNKPIGKDGLFGVNLAKRIQNIYPCTNPNSGKREVIVKYKTYEVV